MGWAGKGALGLCVYGFNALVILSALTGFWLLGSYKSPGPLQQIETLNIPSGTSSARIGQLLLEAGALNDANDILVFKIVAKLTGAAGQLKAGEYELRPAMSLRDVLAMLKQGKVVQRQVTLREGLTSYEMMRLIGALPDLTQAEIAMPAEGTLLPETYSYQKHEDSAALIARMKKAMQETQEELWPSRAKNLPFDTLEEAIILASIVEKETGMADERGKVAGVFINRLRRGIPLQTDPTVIYAITRGKHKNDGTGPLGRRLMTKDLQIESPYNTYKYPGLPPGPIANPGRASIEAVLSPEAHDYIFFVADGTGGHMFAKTLAEHNANVAKWRKIRRTGK